MTETTPAPEQFTLTPEQQAELEAMQGRKHKGLIPGRTAVAERLDQGTTINQICGEFHLNVAQWNRLVKIYGIDTSREASMARRKARRAQGLVPSPPDDASRAPFHRHPNSQAKVGPGDLTMADVLGAPGEFPRRTKREIEEENLRRQLAPLPETPPRLPGRPVPVQPAVQRKPLYELLKERLPAETLRQLLADGRTPAQITDGYSTDPGTLCRLADEYGVLLKQPAAAPVRQPGSILSAIRDASPLKVEIDTSEYGYAVAGFLRGAADMAQALGELKLKVKLEMWIDRQAAKA